MSLATACAAGLDRLRRRSAPQGGFYKDSRIKQSVTAA
jgi:hypothetical protein